MDVEDIPFHENAFHGVHFMPEKFFTEEAYSDGVILVNFLNCKEKYW